MSGKIPVTLYFVTDSHDRTLWWYAGFLTDRYSEKCGHKHKTKEAAEKCKPQMEKLYYSLRWPKSRRFT